MILDPHATKDEDILQRTQVINIHKIEWKHKSVYVIGNKYIDISKWRVNRDKGLQ